MARAKAERPRAKTTILEELTQGIERLEGFLAQVEDFGREGFPYIDAAQVRTELQLRETIKKIFGEKSPECLRYRQDKLSMGTPADTKRSVAFIKDLIASLEDKKLEAQGLKPPASQQASVAPPEPATPRPQMSLVPPVAAASVTVTPAVQVDRAAMTMPVEGATHLDVTQAAAPASPVTAPQPIGAREPATLQAATISPSSTPQMAPHDPTPIPSAQISPSAAPIVQPMAAAPSISPATAESEPARNRITVNDSCDTVKSLCKRFHLVARQLRLRGEYRPTVAVEDDVDAQDLLHALLRVHFDDIETVEWMPSYASATPRTMFLLDEGRLAVVVKKTRAGLNARELAEQFRSDVEHCRTVKRCSTLLCFVYDPEGRIGNPRGLETDLISISDQLTAEVYVAPK